MTRGKAERKKLIFKGDGTLIVSHSGRAATGKWDYIPDAQALLLDVGDEKLLLSAVYCDDAAMILTPDGQPDEVHLFANENMLPDGDALPYLLGVRRQRLAIAVCHMADGRDLEVEYGQSTEAWIGQKATIDAAMAPDGVYVSRSRTRIFFVSNGKVASMARATLLTLDRYGVVEFSTHDGREVLTNLGVRLPSGSYTCDEGTQELIVRDGCIVDRYFHRVLANKSGWRVVLATKGTKRIAPRPGDRLFINKAPAPSAWYRMSWCWKCYVLNGEVRRANFSLVFFDEK